MNKDNAGEIILIVEHESDVTDQLKAVLTSEGYIVYTAADGDEGFEKATLLHPDLIMLDISMPGDAGIRMLRNLQKETDTSDIPVIATGAALECKHIFECRNQVHPIAGFFVKPVGGKQFVAKIGDILRWRGLRARSPSKN
jgi:DNA-binding response OmpR family regulator